MTVTSTHSDEEHVQQRGTFLNLPGEIRDKIYHAALITPKAHYWIDMVEHSLVPPPLLRVNKQIRLEALPIFYGENEFFVSLPNGSDAWTKFFSLCADMASHGHLQHITNLTATYYEETDEDVSARDQLMLGFELKSVLLPIYEELLDRRIGDEHFDWSDRDGVKGAFYDVLSCTAGADYIEIWNDRGIEIDRVADALFALAQHCPQANKKVWLMWEFMV